MRSFLVLTALAAFPVAAQAADRPPELDKLPPVFEAVMDCRAIASEAERLACYDRTVASMAAAREKQDLVVADRQTLRETKRGLFGFSLPKLKIFGGTEGESIDAIETSITSVRRANDGMVIFTIEDGARWKQTEGRNSFAKPGDKVKISRGALGSFWAKIGNNSQMRVIRLVN